MPITNCPEWKYEILPNSNALLSPINAALLVRLSTQPFNLVTFLQDTRPEHRAMFGDLTPPGHRCYAGNYRGSSTCPCLKGYEVTIDGYRGTHSSSVANAMQQMATWIDPQITLLRGKISGLEERKQRFFIAETACRVFMNFSCIHPYANGNGHMSRMLAISLIISCGYDIEDFATHPRPPYTTDYDDCVRKYRKGVKEPFIYYLMSIMRKK